MVNMCHTPRSCAMRRGCWLNFPIPFFGSSCARAIAFARRISACVLNDALLKGCVARDRQMRFVSCSIKKEIHLAYGLLLQRFVGIRDEVFEKLLYLLVQSGQSITTGTPLWKKAKIAI